MEKKEKSLKLNMILNAVKGMLGIIFPLISFPYVSKILGVSNLGKYNFSVSVVNYFSLIAGLGIGTYAIREGARFRENHEKFNSFANEMLTINCVSTFISYILMGIVLVIVPKMHTYCSLILILSIQFVFRIIGIEWLYSVYEDYLYITIRSIIFYCVSIALLFLLVHDENDVNIYCFISVISSVGSNVMNFIHARKYFNFKLTLHVDWKKHLKPIMIFFATMISITIYISSDTTILGFLHSDETVGIYSVSTKIYSIVKTILTSILVVSVPRLSSILGRNEKEEFNSTAEDIYSTLLTFVIPSIIGIMMLSREIVIFISSEEYIQAASSLFLISIALLFSLGAYFWGQCILVPYKKEKVVFKATLISAAANIVLNLILIPRWAENAAAFTTVIAEAIAFVIQWEAGRRYVRFKNIKKTLIKVIIGCIPIVIISILLRYYVQSTVAYLFSVVVLSISFYFLSEILMKNKSIYDVKKFVKKK